MCEYAQNSFKVGDYQQALNCYDLALEINPNEVNIWIERGAILTELEQDLEAVLSYNKAIKIITNTV